MYRELKRQALKSDEFAKIVEDIQRKNCTMRKFFINRKENREGYCEVCGVYIHSINGILGGEKFVTCTKCQKTVCKFRCSSLSDRTGWICNNCLRPPESWFQGILKVIQPNRTFVDQDSKMNFDSLNEADEDIETIRKKKKEQIRDFIEKLVNVMLGENVDDASVSKIYNDKQYDSIFARYHQDLSNGLTDLGSALHISMSNLPVPGQSPSTAHAALKILIERLLQETVNLSNLQKVPEHPATPSDQSERSYEDLLATAIINKVISSSQNHLPSSSGASVSSRISNSSRNQDKEYFFGEETLDSKWKTTDLETTSVSSIEDWLYSDSSFGSKKYVDKVTLTIKQDIEEVSQTDSENEDDDDSEYFRSKSSLLGDDEPNWFLQKRQFQGTNSPVPVPMLVPKPTIDAKVLIGDKELDETSDLSDAASDYGDLDVIPTRQGLLIESKTIIGGKNSLHVGSDGESSADSGVKEVERDNSGYDDPIFEKVGYNDTAFVPKADITVDDDNVEDASILSIYSNTEKEAEYTERYASLPRTILKTPTPPSRPSLNKNNISDSTNIETSTEKPKNENILYVMEGEDNDIDMNEFTGRYSKREKEKWKHAVEMKNNPYSKENIEERIKKSRSVINSLFGPDYYAKQASSPTGARPKSGETNELIWPRPMSQNKESDDETEKKIIIEPVPYSVPQTEVDFTDNSQISTEESATTLQVTEVEGTHESTISELTSDSDISYVNYYDVANSQVYKKSRNGIATDREESENEKNVNGTDEDRIEIVRRAVPTPKERRYIKSQTIYSSPLRPANQIDIRRHKSETDLFEDSFDTTPKVLSRKKDNTLISKIYSQPHVRQFALSSRNQVPVDDAPTTPTFRTQRSLTETTFRYNGKVPLYHSDDGASLHRYSPKSFYSSSEDLLENDSSKEETTPKPKSYQAPTNERVYEIRSKTISMSSEDDVFSEHSSTAGHPIRRTNSKTHLYSSSEDLLSIEEHERPHRKKDNTLIEKIYQDPSVRSFALSSRDYIPVQEDYPRTPKKTYSSEDELSDDHKFKNQIPSPILANSNATNKSQEIILSPHQNQPMEAILVMENTEAFLAISPPAPFDRKEESLNVQISSTEHPGMPSDRSYERNITSPDPEINEIAKKKIVHNILEQISGHHPEHVGKHKLNGEINNNEEEEISVSVKELRKKFENNDGKNIVISSLTARSLPKQIRENLRK